MTKFMEFIDEDKLAKGPLWKNFVSGDVTYQMKPGDHIIIATSDQNDGQAIITLPSLAEAAGKFYYICAPTGASGGDISVYEKETGSELSTYGDLDADDDHVLLFSDGRKWRVVLDGVA